MNYTKPEVAVLGEAVRVIEQTRQSVTGAMLARCENSIPPMTLTSSSKSGAIGQQLAPELPGCCSGREYLILYTCLPEVTTDQWTCETSREAEMEKANNE